METYNKPANINNAKVDSSALLLAGQKTIKSMLAKLLSVTEGKTAEELIDFYSQHEVSSAQYYIRKHKSSKKTSRRRY